MLFILEVNKNRKDTIVYNNHKYREKYSVKSGDIVWQCLGRVCKASITTNNDKTAIHHSSDNHSGRHPVTMRSHTPTPPSKRASCSVASKPGTPEATPSPRTPTETSEPTPVTHNTATEKSSPPNRDPLEKNMILRDEFDRLRAEAEWNRMSANNWLTDDHIRIYMEVLISLTVDSTDGILFLNPSVCHAVKLSADFSYLLNPLNLTDKSVIFAPINNNMNPEEEGGSHWSLLIYVKECSSFFYYDSSSCSNTEAAQVVCTKLAKYISNNDNPQLSRITGPTQDNGYDCALYCILAIEYFLKNISKGNIFQSPLPSYGVVDCLIKRAIMTFVIQNRYSMTKNIIQTLMDATEPLKEQCPSCHTESIQQLKSNLIKKTEETEKLKEKIKALMAVKDKYEHFKSPKKTCKSVSFSEPETPISNRFHVFTDESDDCDELVVDMTNDTSTVGVPRRQRRIKQVKYKPNEHHINRAQNRHNIIILTDSHGRGLGDALQDLVPGQVTAFVKPGAKFDAVVDNVEAVANSMGSEETLVVIAGTNNINAVDDVDGLLSQMEVLMDKTKHSNLIIASIPVRHDSPWLNSKIAWVNKKLYDSVTYWKHVHILPLHKMPRYYHTNHGLHFNKRGKKIISRDISQLIKGSHLQWPVKLNSIYSGKASVNVIKVLNKNMNQVISQFRSRTDIAFSHCISADIHSARHMTAGVAVTFARNFGRPTNNNIVGSHLSFQQSKNEAAVYGLITKPKYSDKPTTTDYDRAFNQFTQHFLSKGFKHLICSPMGCVRDNIQLKHFVRNLSKFQRATKAGITIVSYDQTASRILFNGLNHDHFCNAMKSLIYREQHIQSFNGSKHENPFPCGTYSAPCEETSSPSTTDVKEPSSNDRSSASTNKGGFLATDDLQHSGEQTTPRVAHWSTSVGGLDVQQGVTNSDCTLTPPQYNTTDCLVDSSFKILSTEDLTGSGLDPSPCLLDSAVPLNSPLTYTKKPC